MERLAAVFKSLHNSIHSRKIDFELLQNLKQTVSSFHITKDDFLKFVKLMTEVYELSNNEKLYQIKRTSISIGQMAIELKIIVCKMMSLIIVYFEKQESANSIPFEILTEAVEILIICARVCLNEGSNKYISLIQEFYKFVHSPFDLVSAIIKKDVRFLHQINVLELMRYKCENQSFSIVEFQKRLSQVVLFEQYNLQEYKGFVQNIVMEIVLKSIKNGKLKPDGIKHFYSYLSEENQKDLNCLVFDPKSSIKNMETGSQFLQIYKQVKEKGIESINIEFLEDFIKTDKNFNDERVFQIAALTLEPVILQIWFTVFNLKKQKSPILQKALMCFMHIVDSIMYHNKYPSKQILDGVLKLSNSVTFAMLTEKKSSFTNQPVLHIIKTFVKALKFLCFSLHQPWDQIKDFGERTVLLCSRYQCMEVVKVIYAVMLYYCLVKKIKCEELYQKFAAHHNTQKSSEIYKFLSCAYEVQNSGNQGVGDLRIDQALKTQMRKQPFIAMLFAKKNEDMTIFQIEPSEFKELKQKFYIYSEMLKKYRKDETNVAKILNHLEDFLIKTNINEFQAYMQVSQQENIAIQELFLILIEMLQERQPKNKAVQKDKQNDEKKDVQHMLDFLEESNIIEKVPQDYTLVSSQISFILINLDIMGNQTIAKEFKQTGFGILLNKYSAKIKLINVLAQMIKNGTIHLEQEIYNIFCSYLITILEKFKKITINKERLGEPGEIYFVHSIAQLMETFHELNEKKNSKKDIEIDAIAVGSKQRQAQSAEVVKTKKNQKNFINFTIFQIDCITGNTEKYLKFVDKLPVDILKAFTHSVYAPKTLKQKIFRKIMRQNFTQTKCDVSLKEFKQIIEVTDDPQEIQLYVQFVFSTFGEDGRKMVMLMANQNKKIQKILLKQNDVEI